MTSRGDTGQFETTPSDKNPRRVAELSHETERRQGGEPRGAGRLDAHSRRRNRYTYRSMRAGFERSRWKNFIPHLRVYGPKAKAVHHAFNEFAAVP